MLNPFSAVQPFKSQKKGNGMCYPVAIVREITLSSTDRQMRIVGINDLSLMF